MGFLLSLFLGFAPVFLFAYFIYWLDRYEKEPKILLVGIFLWGAVIAAGAALVINSLLGMGVFLFTNSEVSTELATGSLIAPVVEEILKGFAVLVVYLFALNEFDSILDGIVYAAIVALGFAATENAYYIYSLGYQRAGLAGLFWLAFVRIILVGWQHPFYTAFFGIGLALARLNRNNLFKLVSPLAGLSIAILLHSVHNTLDSLIRGGPGLVAGAFFDWSGWSIMFLFIVWAILRERNWISNQLREEVTLGVITSDQYDIACSSWAQSLARWEALFKGHYQITSRFYQLCAELAYKKQQRSSLGEEGGNTQIIERLRVELSRLSPLA